MKIIYFTLIGILAPTGAIVLVNPFPFQNQPPRATTETPIIIEQKPINQKQTLWGAYTGISPGDLLELEQKVGKSADMQAVFTGWGETYGNFPSEFKSTIADQNKTLVIFWEPYDTTLDKIIAGKEDEYIKKWAAEAKAYEGPIIVAPFHEMNGNWNPWDGSVGSNSAAKLIAAWRHLHQFFTTSDNVKFAFVVNSRSVPNTEENRLENYYPGDNYVDFVGVDGFNFGDPWNSFDQIFADPLNRLKKYNKPIYIFSMASADGPQKAAWIRDALAKIKADPTIEGFIWFNQNKEENWLIDSNAASLEAFKAALE